MATLGSTRRKTRSIKLGSPWQVLVALLLVSILLMTFWARESSAGSGPLLTVRKAYTVVTSPLSRLGAVLGTPFRAIGNAVGNSAMSGDDIQALKDENEELRSTVMQLEEYRQEEQRLAALLDIRDAYDLESVGARVIGRTSDSYNRTITLDKGSDDGIAAGMPVMSPQGLIGQGESVTSSQATVRLLFDTKGTVSVMIQSSRSEGVLHGSYDGLLYLDYIPITQQVLEGDVVLTSGSGGTYPKGIMIGQVVSVTDKTNDVYHTIVVTPLAGDTLFEEVLIVTGRQTEVTYEPKVSPEASISPSPEDEDAVGRDQEMEYHEG